MPDHASWRPLPATVPGIPNLLVSATFTSESYIIRLSDLANVWVESMDRKPIIKRGLVEDTSIDPSDGPDQIRKMLELIKAAFDPADPEHTNTSMTLGQDERGSEHSLVIHITCLLPKPLRHFKWPIHLSKCAQSSLATELVLPLIQAHQARSREIDLLLTALKEKDGVINRLVDKLDATGTNLEYVFNSLSGKRKVTRQAAEGKVKGLAPFPEADFRRQANGFQPPTEPLDVPSLLERVFGSTGLRYKPEPDLEASSALNDWWTKLGKGKHLALADRSRENISSIPASLPTAETKTGDDDDGDDFQVQTTPPGLSSRRKRDTATRPQVPDDDETSDGEDESEVPDRVPPQSKRTTPNKSSDSQLGVLGRLGKSPSPAPPPRPTASQKDQGGDSDTASEPDEDEEAAPSPPKPPPRRGGLGRIGGKARQKTPPSEPLRSPSPAAPEQEASHPVERHKLGAIGKKRPGAGPTTKPESGSEDERGRTSKRPPAAVTEQRPRETSQERADRKRIELEEELRKKAAAGPAKKKRKF